MKPTKQHQFAVTVRGASFKREARFAILAAFARRNPDGCRFTLAERLTTGERNVIRFAADMLDHQARLIEQGATRPDGLWPADSAADRKEFDQLMWAATELRAIAPTSNRKI